MASKRLGNVLFQLQYNASKVSGSRGRPMSSLPSFEKKPDDIVIVSALRTPIGKAKRGSFKDTYGDELLATAFKGVLEDTKIDPKEIGDICVGNVLEPSAATQARIAQFYCDIPEEVPIASTNRQCSSGLNAVMTIAGNIRNGVCKVGLAAGYESMSTVDLVSVQLVVNPNVQEKQLTKDCLLPMGFTSENVATKYGITREEQDEFALRSQQNAGQAVEKGLFDAEIVPVRTKIKDESGQEKEILVTKDDGVRPTTLEKLAQLKPAFKEGGSTTPGNSSQVSDGASACVMMTREEAAKRSLPILGILRSYAVKGCPPSIMGIGPAIAIPIALEKAGLKVDDIDIFEINEAFASQALYSQREVGIPSEKVNPKGGAIALGHPVGCTGVRQIATLLHELKRRENRAFGVTSMCLGTGMGAAAVFEYPGKE